MKDLYIIGAGGLGREVAWVVERINAVEKEWNLIGFIDDDLDKQGQIINDLPVVGTVDYLVGHQNAYTVCAIGSPKIKREIIEKLKKNAPQLHYATLIDPSVKMSRFVEIGEGTIICPGCILTVNITIGKQVYLNLDSTVGHDAIIGDYVSIMPSANISGCTDIGEGTEIGTGVQIIQGIKICADTVIGAGAVVVKNIEEAGVYTGVPAKRLEK